MISDIIMETDGKGKDMGKVRTIENLVYRENVGKAGMLDLYLPETEKCKTLLIFFHGGGLENGDKTDDSIICNELAACGIAIVSANYRMYPDVIYPQYIEDAAKAVAWSLKHIKEYIIFDQIFIGGISAGAYLSMMLHFQPGFLAGYDVSENQISGYIFDAGQPTVHYNILKERGQDPRSVRVDEAAPIYYLEGKRTVERKQRFLILISDQDIVGRREQNELLIRTMETHGYEKSQINYQVIKGYHHAGYENVKDAEGGYPYVRLLCEFIESDRK